MADTDLVVDIAVGNGDIGEHEVRVCKAFDHFAYDQRADVFIGQDGFETGFVDRGAECPFPQALEVDLIWRSTPLCGTSRFGVVRHDHEADWAWHRDPSK